MDARYIWLLVAIAIFVRSAPAALEDVTSHGIASQTSEWNGGQFPAENAIDGDPGTFSHSDRDSPNNAWELVLDQEWELVKVELAMRTDCCGGRLTGVTLRLFDGEGDSVFDSVLTDPGPGQSITVDLPPDTLVRRMRVGFENGATNPGTATTLLHLGEVRVFAEVDLLPNIVSFEASNHYVASGGSSEISWQTEGSDSVELVGVGTVAEAGLVSASPASSQIYTLVATNEHGSRTSNLAVVVDGILLDPRVTEFMASNASSLVRSDASTPDWIEIWNPNPEPIDLTGYRLTDDPEQPARFVFPATTLEADTYLVADAATNSLDDVLATGFSLDRAADSYLAFHDPAGIALQEFTYPGQHEDVSYGVDWNGVDKFFLEPTPGTASVAGAIDGFVADTKFSVGRGFYDSPQSVAVTSATDLATIYTTLDGSEPTPDNPNASVYTAPLTIDSTTVLRAAAYLDGFLPANVDTQTYLFPADVGAQSSSPVDFPQSWVPSLNGVQSSVPAFSHFGMDVGVIASLPLVDGTGQNFDLVDALTSIPTMSLVMDAEVMFDPVDGLHINARSRGRTWERPASIEYIDPTTGEQIHANCGIRMHGGWNRFPEMLKKAFRLYFRSEYGDSRLKFPLFPDSPNDEIDGIILRSGNGKSWASPWRALSGGGNSLPRNTYMRDQFVRDLQAATGNVHVPGRFVHLYINGHYWGLYNPVERPDEGFAAARYGGVEDDYDVIKWQRGIGHQVAAGDDVGWNTLIGFVRGNTRDPATYAAVADLLDLPSFVDYMLVNYFVGNGDWIDNNVYAMRNRTENGPFRFYCWDSEECLLSTGTDVTDRVVNDTCTEIHIKLRSNAEYRQLFADRAQRHLFNGGALTQEVTDAIFAARAAEIDQAIVGDSARWGNLHRPSDPYDRADWLNEVANLRNNYLGQRVDITLSQLRVDNLFPGTAAPTFSPQRGGEVPTGLQITLDSAVVGNRTTYYTLDGSDPRLPGGEVSPSAIVFDGVISQEVIFPAASSWQYDDDGIDRGNSDIVDGAPAYDVTNWKHPEFDSSAWASGVAPLGYGGISGGSITTQVDFGSDTSMKHTTTYFRHPFVVPDATRYTALRIRLVRDDGAIVYLNGHEVARSAFPQGDAPISASTFAIGVSGSAEGTTLAFEIPANLLVDGENVFAVEVHQASNNSSDLGFSLELEGDVLAVGSGLIEVQDDTLVRTRVLADGEWSALDEALFITGDRAADLFVSEIMYHPAPGGAEYLEISNRGTNTHALGDLAITGGIQFEFASATESHLAPGERSILVRDAAQFASVYPGVAIAGEYSGALGNGGDSFSLMQEGGVILWTVSYDDTTPWPVGTDGDGRSLTYVSGDQNSATSWRASVAEGGSPSETDRIPFVPGGDLIAYAIARYPSFTLNGEQLELQIPTRLGADDAVIQAEWSVDLIDWNTAGFIRTGSTTPEEAETIELWHLDLPSDEQLFLRARVRLR